ncbi:hypothetical protein [Aequorivita capsosiphonis]|uniref:hypothetical protein n=1 Tax=Aequorivita capsosiphonis TaxID=487317 RepID=UPI0003FC75C2|nr:hypothetical protein [Aequorivita capsosiphonis]
MDFEFKSNDTFTKRLKAYGIHDFQSLLFFVKNLPYGRNTNREDLYLIISESKGTCSSKHAFLKAVAMENNFSEVKLMLGIYKMSEINTPKITPALSENNLNYIPEAHCYLKYKDERVDVTSATSDFARIKKDIMKEIEILPEQVSNFKVDFHKNYLKKWLTENEVNFTFEEVWEIREKCINNISL